MPKASAPSAPCVAVVRVAAHDSHARQGEALLGSDHMDDALARIVQAKLGDAELGAIGVQRLQLQPGQRIGDLAVAVRRRHIVICHRQVGGDAPHLARGKLQALEGLRRGHLVQQMPINVEQAQAAAHFADEMLIPKLVVESSCGCHFFSVS